MLKEFKEFAMKGNVIDLAVGIIIGGAFGKIVSSLVGDIIMPILGLLIGKVNFTNLKFVLRPAAGDSVELALRYGQFFQSVIDFLVISFAIFIVIRAANKLKRKQKQVLEAKPKISQQEILLTEIRDLLKVNAK